MRLLGGPKLHRERSDISTWDWAESGWDEEVCCFFELRLPPVLCSALLNLQCVQGILSLRGARVWSKQSARWFRCALGVSWTRSLRARGPCLSVVSAGHKLFSSLETEIGIGSCFAAAADLKLSGARWQTDAAFQAAPQQKPAVLGNCRWLAAGSPSRAAAFPQSYRTDCSQTMRERVRGFQDIPTTG